MTVVRDLSRRPCECEFGSPSPELVHGLSLPERIVVDYVWRCDTCGRMARVRGHGGSAAALSVTSSPGEPDYVNRSSARRRRWWHR